ncbi:hypothetical protein V3481_012683 [Fusarium oxysporum f. sp. vasinfectum]
MAADEATHAQIQNRRRRTALSGERRISGTLRGRERRAAHPAEGARQMWTLRNGYHKRDTKKTMVAESSQRHRELLQVMHGVSADSAVCSGITIRELEPRDMVGMDLPRSDQPIVSRRAAIHPAVFGWSRVIYRDNGSHFVNMKLRMAADRQGIKMELGPDLSSFLYWFARTCRPPGKETNPKVGSGKGGTLVMSLTPGSTRGHDQPQ